jgi:hypothetical protein
MAIGDAAVAAGMTIVPGTLPANQLDTEINRTRDEIANRTSAVTPVAKGGTGATTAAAARTALGVPATAHTHRITDVLTSDGTGPYAVALQAALDAKQNTGNYIVQGAGDIHTGGGRLNSIGSRNFSVSVNYVSAYLDGNNWLGITPSAERFKQDIEEAAYTLADALRLAQCVATYRLRARVEGVMAPEGDGWETEPDPDAPGEVGVIAEWLIREGFPEFVVFNDAGETLSVNYERLSLVVAGGLAELAQTTLAIAAEVTDIRDRLGRLEGTTA